MSSLISTDFFTDRYCSSYRSMGQYRFVRSRRKRLPWIGRDVRDFSRDEDRDHTDSIRDCYLERLLSESAARIAKWIGSARASPRKVRFPSDVLPPTDMNSSQIHHLARLVFMLPNAHK